MVEFYFTHPSLSINALKHQRPLRPLMGDATKEVEHQLLSQKKTSPLMYSLSATADASDTAFLAAVQPDYSVISVNHRNLRVYPDQGTLRRLALASEQILRTDEQGDICLRLPTINPVTPCKLSR